MISMCPSIFIVINTINVLSVFSFSLFIVQGAIGTLTGCLTYRWVIFSEVSAILHSKCRLQQNWEKNHITLYFSHINTSPVQLTF